ncbi:MAG: hypothetical protein ACRCU5_16430 [Rhizobiaceae bacterium]
MELWQLGLLVGGGISLIVYLVHAAGGSKKAVLANGQAAIDRFREDYPDLTQYLAPSKVHLTHARDAAFLELPDRTVGLVHAIGDSYLTRVLTGKDVTKNLAKEATLSLTIDDFTFKGGTYMFANESEMRAVEKLLNNTGAPNA